MRDRPIRASDRLSGTGRRLGDDDRLVPVGVFEIAHRVLTMNLREIVRGSGNIEDVAAHLENLMPGQRWGELHSLSRRDQRTLWLKAEASDPVTPADFVPEDIPAGRPVPYLGRNSLPLFRDFSKPMSRTDNGVVYGFNEQTWRRLIGPGYFVMRSTRGPEAALAGAVVDYFQVPQLGPAQLPEGFPLVKPNSRGLQWFVYHKTRDYMRRVAPGVFIGAAYKTILGRERPLNSTFLLMRKGG